jgi:hypothetical protein
MKTSKITAALLLALSLFVSQQTDAQRITVRINPRPRPRRVIYVEPRPVYVAPLPVYVVPRPVYAGAWQILGTTVVDFALDRDMIRVGGAGSFRFLKFVVRDATIELLDMDVIYENGGHDDIPVRQVIERGGESRIIDLRGGSRRIRQVSFVYRSVPNFVGRRAELTLFGIN